MKAAFVLGLAVVLGLALTPSVAPAFDPASQGVQRTPGDQWANWPPRQNFDHFHRFHQPNVVVVPPNATVVVPQTVWVPGQWFWNGFTWAWMPGHWQAF